MLPTLLSPPQHDTLLSPPQHDTLLSLLCPPQHDTLLSPPQHDTLLSPPQHDTLLCPPQHDTLLSPPQHDTLLCPPQHDTLLCPPPHDTLLCPPPHDTLLSPPQYDSPSSPSFPRDILAAGGTVGDAAIAALLCVGVVKPQSMGLGGGFMLTHYNPTTGQALTLDARERAPLAAHQDMYHGDAQLSFVGALAVAVPGEVRGYRALYEAVGGALEWAELFVPALRLCEEGHPVSWHLAKALQQKREYILAEPSMSIFVDNTTGDVLLEGDMLYRPDLAATLRVLQQEPDALYTGSLARGFVEDLAQLGGIITTQDMEEYQVTWSEAMTVALNTSNATLITGPPPGSGVLLGFMLNVLDGYGLDPNDVQDVSSSVLTHQRITETFKYAYALRTQLGDPQYVDVQDLLSNLTSEAYAEYIRLQVLDNSTSQDPEYYGGQTYIPRDHGTAHISILGPNGDAIAVTSTINSYFGAVMMATTGIIYNNEMDDFSSPNITNDFGLPPSPANFIVPGKRPMSSMCPAIVTDGADGAGMVRMVAGAAGGTKITTSTALTIIHHLWLGSSIEEAVEGRRIHHQLYPMVLNYEEGFDAAVVEGLAGIGHVTEEMPALG
ncbi:glutathione hydrolase 1 proenzyme, partial [Hyalella azteca]|uniref:Glutathione hydrolase 1 proenzyme n=1 Tax=Hyalella azteca TaxID=294128 RepID=A0A8B7PHB8_HYAAZ